MKKTKDVVLLEDVENLGIKGDSKKVAIGFARNYLLVKKLAVLANDPQAKKIIEKLKEERARIEAEIQKIKELAEKLSSQEIVIKAKVGEKGKLFGSVTNKEIADKIKVEAKKITIKPIKELGEHQVEVKFAHGIKANIKIKVIAAETKTKKIIK